MISWPLVAPAGPVAGGQYSAEQIFNSGIRIGGVGINPLMFDAYAGKGTEPLPATADSGQTWVTVNNGTAGAGLTIVSGQLTNTATAATSAAGYANVQLAQNVTRIGGDITFGAGATTGSADLIVWKTTPSTLPATVPDSGCHVAFNPTDWQYGVWQANAFTLLASGNYATALTQDGATAYRVEIDIVGNTAYLLLPDGTTARVTDARISTLAGPWACFEVFQNNASTECRGAFVNVWADYGKQDRTAAATVGDVLRVVDAVRGRPLELLGPVSIGQAPATNAAVQIGSAITASSGVAELLYFNGSMIAAANSDNLKTVSFTGVTFNTSAKSGVNVSGINVEANSWTSTGTPQSAAALALFEPTIGTYNAALTIGGQGAGQYAIYSGSSHGSYFAAGITLNAGGLTVNAAPAVNFNYASTAAGTGGAPTLPANTPTGATGGAGKWIQVQLQGATAYVLAWQ